MRALYTSPVYELLRLQKRQQAANGCLRKQRMLLYALQEFNDLASPLQCLLETFQTAFQECSRAAEIEAHEARAGEGLAVR